MATSRRTIPTETLRTHLAYLKLGFVLENYTDLVKQAAEEHWDHIELLSRLMEGEALLRSERSTQRRVRLARFPVIKTLDRFQWSWPKKINRPQVQNLFRLDFIEQKANVVFIGGVGLGKTHLATALGYTACLKGYSVLFAGAIDTVNNLAAAKKAGRLKQEINKYLKPSLKDQIEP